MLLGIFVLMEVLLGVVRLPDKARFLWLLLLKAKWHLKMHILT
jgi:hypothetical protein